MALLRKHWKLALCECLAVVAALTIGLHFFARHAASADVSSASVSSASVSSASAATQPAALDPLSWSRIAYLRQQLALTSLDLGAMGLSQAQASSVLTHLKSWYTTNQANWDPLEQAKISDQRSLQEAWREVNVGPANPSALAQLPTLQQNLASSTQAFQQFLQSASSTVTSVLSTSQQQVWSTAQQNVSAPAQYRYAPSLSSGAIATLSVALAKGQAAAATTLGVQQQQAIGAAQAAQAESMPGVLAAEQAVLPPPAPISGASN